MTTAVSVESKKPASEVSVLRDRVAALARENESLKARLKARETTTTTTAAAAPPPTTARLSWWETAALLARCVDLRRRSPRSILLKRIELCVEAPALSLSSHTSPTRASEV